MSGWFDPGEHMNMFAGVFFAFMGLFVIWDCLLYGIGCYMEFSLYGIVWDEVDTFMQGYFFLVLR